VEDAWSVASAMRLGAIEIVLCVCVWIAALVLAAWN